MKVTILAVVFSFVLAGAAEVPAMPQSCLPDPAVVVAAAAKATTARFPDADSVIVDDRIHTQYEADGSDITWDDEWIKVLTEKGRRSLAQVTFGFSERYGDAGILKVEIIGTNGVARTVDFAQTLKIATDNSSMGSNIYDPLDKEGSCAVPGLQVGEIRHVRTYRRTRKARMHDTWADMNLLELTRPILSTTISVDQPAARPVVHAVVRNPFGSTVTRAPAGFAVSAAAKVVDNNRVGNATRHTFFIILDSMVELLHRSFYHKIVRKGSLEKRVYFYQ